MTQALREHRRRLMERGMRRVELSATQTDVDLLRRVAKTLVQDDERAEQLRQVLAQVIPDKPRLTFKEWLAAE
jgi:phosphohistidine phosphatase SixA